MKITIDNITVEGTKEECEEFFVTHFKKNSNQSKDNDGGIRYYKNGEPHWEDGPTTEFADGPAIEFADGRK